MTPESRTLPEDQCADAALEDEARPDGRFAHRLFRGLAHEDAVGAMAQAPGQA